MMRNVLSNIALRRSVFCRNHITGARAAERIFTYDAMKITKKMFQ